ncbi:DUF2004 domain-containing protein [Paenibacillus sp. FSL K6-1096]|uniref:DUF6985 domain-containing protein n=1 Tax=Paenibacillus sp. FSL K6-1096 TaxID=2921460 RepID=UPI0030EF8BB3
MIIDDEIFGELNYEFGWTKDTTIEFFGKEYEISIMIDGEEDEEIDEEQYESYSSLMQHWGELQHSFIDAILKYYIQKRHELGYDVEVNESYPLITSTDQLLNYISLSGITIPFPDINEGRDIGITFDCTWDNENGLGLRVVNEQVLKVGYQDVAI